MSIEKHRQQQSPYDYSVKRLLSQDTNSPSTGKIKYQEEKKQLPN